MQGVLSAPLGTFIKEMQTVHSDAKKYSPVDNYTETKGYGVAKNLSSSKTQLCRTPLYDHVTRLYTVGYPKFSNLFQKGISCALHSLTCEEKLSKLGLFYQDLRKKNNIVPSIYWLEI